MKRITLQRKKHRKKKKIIQENEIVDITTIINHEVDVDVEQRDKLIKEQEKIMKECKKNKRKTWSSSIKTKKRQKQKYNFSSEDSVDGYTSGSDSSDVFASGPDTQNLDTSDEEQDSNFLYDTPNQSPSKGKISKSSN